ncbi:MAG: hypothetical protein ABJB12_08915 [Pseudomonadota bacterium]
MKPFCFISTSSLLLAAFSLTSSAFAQDSDEVTGKGTGANVNQDRPALPAVAANTPAGRFGDKGQLTVSSDAGLSIGTTSVSGVDGSTTTVTLRPAVDYFIANDLSLGGFVGLDYLRASGAHSTTFSIGPRIGYNLALSERVTLWPKLGFSYSNTNVSTDVNAGPNTVISTGASGSHVALNVFVPVMFHPVPHFFIGFGPALDTDLSGDARTTTIAGRLTIGGWM